MIFRTLCAFKIIFRCDHFTLHRKYFLVSDVPHVQIDVVKVVGAHRIFLNWTVNDGNSPIKEYNIMVASNIKLF